MALKRSHNVVCHCNPHSLVSEYKVTHSPLGCLCTVASRNGPGPSAHSSGIHLPTLKWCAVEMTKKNEERKVDGRQAGISQSLLRQFIMSIHITHTTVVYTRAVLEERSFKRKTSLKQLALPNTNCLIEKWECVCGIFWIKNRFIDINGLLTQFVFVRSP